MSVRLQDHPLYALLDPAVRPDPYPILAGLREAGPLWTDDRTVIVGDHATCLAALRDPALGNDTLKALAAAGALPAGMEDAVLESIFFMDPPDHGRQRRLVSKAFTPRITARYEPWIRGIVDDLLPAGGRTFDAVRDFAGRLSMRTICELMDIPAGDVDLLKDWSDELALATEVPTLVAAFGTWEVFSPEELAGFGRASVAIHAYFADLIHKRRTRPGDDLISSLIRTEDQGHALARHEVTNVLATLFAAAHESVTNLVANGLLALSRDPAQLAALRNDHSLAPRLVDEVLRYDAPVQLTARVALAPTRLGPAAVEPGTIVILLLAAAGRDEAAYLDAGRLLADRRPAAMNLSFGAGAHYCIGSSLARAEAAIAFTAVAERLTGFGVEEESLAYRRHVVVRGPLRMTVHHR